MSPNKLAVYFVADIFVADMVLADMVVADMVCGRYGRTPPIITLVLVLLKVSWVGGLYLTVWLVCI